MSSVEDENGGDSSKMKAKHQKKPHKKLLSGLKVFKTVKSSNSGSENDLCMKSSNGVVSELPHHLITHHILTRLSVKNLLQFKSISKEWYSTISSSEFAKLHLDFHLSSYQPWFPVECLFVQAENNYYILYYQEKDEVLDYYFVKLETDFDYQQGKDELHLIGSCNGLVCLVNSSPTSGYFYIWNPITHSWQKFSDPYTLSFQYRTSWGFAYASSVDDYKIVRLVQNCSTHDHIVAHVFSLKTRNWKRVIDHGLDCQVSLTKTDPGVLVDEKLYWFMDTNHGSNRSLEIVGFDLVLEKFDKFSDLVPRSFTPWHQFLCVMGGCLSICSLNMNDEVYISILRQSGQVESICLPSDLVLQFCSVVVGFTRNNRFFVVSKNWKLTMVEQNLSPKQNSPLITFRKGRRPCIVSYNPSLVSPTAISGL